MSRGRRIPSRNLRDGDMHSAFEENPTGERPEAYWAVVADLVALIQRTRELQHTAPLAGARVPAKAFTPEALSDCNQRLRDALHVLLEARSSAKQQASRPQL
jgi:hypothetical protein